MKDIDRALLLDMVDKYSLEEVVRDLSNIVQNKADDMSDMGIKEKAIDFSNYSEMLDEVARAIND